MSAPAISELPSILNSYHKTPYPQHILLAPLLNIRLRLRQYHLLLREDGLVPEGATAIPQGGGTGSPRGEANTGTAAEASVSSGEYDLQVCLCW